jgi:hypothetical protein
VLRRDPGDLIALPALCVSGWLWTRRRPGEPALPPAGWAALSLAILATVADSGAPDFGIHCLAEKEGTLYALGYYQTYYVSTDGGKEWREDTDAHPDFGSGCGGRRVPWQMTDSRNPRIVYRFSPGVAIEKSSDAGQSWHTEVDVSWEQARILHHDRKFNDSYGSLSPGPHDALIDPATGQVIVAMGQQGILRGTPDGEWEWIGVGKYFRGQPSSFGDVVAILSTELWLGLVLALLMISTLDLRIHKLNIRQWTTWVRMPLLLLGWGAWLFAAIYMAPATTNSFGYAAVLIQPPLWLAALLGAPLALQVLFQTYYVSQKALRVLVITAVCSAVLYLTPYLIWSAGGIPRYNTASVFAVVLIAAALFAGDRYLQRALQRSQPLDDRAR